MTYEKPFFLASNIEDTKPFKSFDADTQKQILQLREHGYCIFKPEIGAETIDKAVDDCNELYNKTDYKGAGNSRVQNAFRTSPSVKSIATNKGILDLLRAAFGKEPFPFQTLNFNVGSQQETHSDSIHFNSFPFGFMCGVWVAFESIDEENGPLHYYPGSHKLPFFGMEELGIHGSEEREAYSFYSEYENHVKSLIATSGLKKETVKMEKGDCLIWAANLLHGGEPILDEARSRHSQVTHYYFEDCLYYTPLRSSLLKREVFVRRPYNILSGKKISLLAQRRFAKAAGIGIDGIRASAAKIEIKRFLRRLGL